MTAVEKQDKGKRGAIYQGLQQTPLDDSPLIKLQEVQQTAEHADV